MSPRSRGRPAGRGRPKGRRVSPVRRLGPAEALLRDAALVAGPLDAELLASRRLGEAWLTAPMTERDSDAAVCGEVARRAEAQPSLPSLAALVALRRVLPEPLHPLLDEAVHRLSAHHPMPSWSAAPPFEPVRAWRAVDVWDSERVLLVDFDSADPHATAHTLMAHIADVAGTLVAKLGVLPPGAADAWERTGAPGEVPMPLVETTVAGALADLADALRSGDMMWPRPDGEDFVALRALAWSRCRAYLPDWPDVAELPDAERAGLIEDFLADAAIPDDVLPDAEAAASIADLLLDYGDGYLHNRPLGWSPDAVMLFLVDYLPRKVALDAGQRAALPEVLRRWLRFALHRRGVPPEWIVPVVAAVEEFLPDFADAFDDTAAWGPAKQVAAELTARGVDLGDREAVDAAVRALNAENLARRLIEPPDRSAD